MNFLKNIDKTWSLFLDRDGVINERNMEGYILTHEAFHFIEGTKEAIAHFSKVFNHVFVVTNQQGVGKGLMTECNLLEIHRLMEQEIQLVGGKLTKCYFSSDLKSSNSTTRKPAIGMALTAKLEFPSVDFSKSIMIGDTDSDIQFGKNAGMQTVRIQTQEAIGIEADVTVKSLKEFADLLIM